jgi:hypothetical protein
MIAHGTSYNNNLHFGLWLKIPTQIPKTIDRNSNGNNNNTNNNNSNDDDDGAVVAAHSTDYDYCSDDDISDDISDYKLIISTDDGEKADEATLLANIKEDVPSSPSSVSNYDDFKTTILASTVAEYNDDLQEIEDGFVNRINNQQDVDDAINDDEPEALACAHVDVIDDINYAVGDDFVVVDNTGAVQALDSPVDDLLAPSLNEDVHVLIDTPSPIATSSDKDVAVPIVPSPIATSSDKDDAVPIVPSPIVTSSDKDVAVPIVTSYDKDVAGRHGAQDKITAVFCGGGGCYWY